MGAPTAALGSPSPLPVRADGPAPTAAGQRFLLFLFVVLAEYWLTPAFIGVTNYAGLWEELGALLFVGLVTSLLGLVVVPILPRLRIALRARSRRVTFHLIWTASFVLGLFLTNILQFDAGPAAPAVAFGEVTIYTPLGAWPSLTVYLAPLGLWSTFNVEGPTVLFLISFLSAAAVVLGPMQRPIACPAPGVRIPSRARRLVNLVILAPLGFVTGCAGCSPAYFAALALVAPGLAEGGYAALPLVPWLGFAGLFYLLGFWLAVRLIAHNTSPPEPPRPVAVPG